jgi:hypothetical protein
VADIGRAGAGRGRGRGAGGGRDWQGEDGGTSGACPATGSFFFPFPFFSVFSLFFKINLINFGYFFTILKFVKICSKSEQNSIWNKF